MSVTLIKILKPDRLNSEKYSYDTDIWSLGMTLLECKLGKHPLNLEKYLLLNIKY